MSAHDEAAQAVKDHLAAREIGCYSAGEIAEGMGLLYPQTAVLRRLRQMAEFGIVEEIAGARGSKWRYARNDRRLWNELRETITRHTNMRGVMLLSDLLDILEKAPRCEVESLIHRPSPGEERP